MQSNFNYGVIIRVCQIKSIKAKDS
jgi:hypothetical protein